MLTLLILSTILIIAAVVTILVVGVGGLLTVVVFGDLILGVYIVIRLVSKIFKGKDSG